MAQAINKIDSTFFSEQKTNIILSILVMLQLHENAAHLPNVHLLSNLRPW